jgi:caffeoyl-CoA O-methyltransferase
MAEKFDLDAWRRTADAVRREDERQRRAGLPPAQRYRSLHPDSARVLYQLALASRARRIVEVGMSAGYSTLWLARACAATGGKVTAVEVNAEIIPTAEEHFSRAGVRSYITVVAGDARDALAEVAAAADLAFIDGEKREYAAYAELIWPGLAVGGSLLADNVISHAGEVGPFFEYLGSLEGAATVTLDVGNGLSWTVKESP